jgi:hypothetical protein
MTQRFAHNMAPYPNGPCDYPPFAVACQRGWSRVSAQNDNVLFAQSRNVLLTTSRLGRWPKDNY